MSPKKVDHKNETDLLRFYHFSTGRVAIQP